MAELDQIVDRLPNPFGVVGSHRGQCRLGVHTGQSSARDHHGNALDELVEEVGLGEVGPSRISAPHRWLNSDSTTVFSVRSGRLADNSTRNPAVRRPG